MIGFGNFLEAVYGSLFTPRQTLKLIAERRSFGQAIVLFFVSLLLTPWAPGAEGFLSSFASWASFAVIGLVAWILASAIFSIVAELFGGKGSAAGLFAAIGFSVLPRIVGVPFWVVASFLPEQPKLIAVGLISAIVYIWTFFLNLEAMRASYNISIGRALLVFVASVLIIAAAIIAVAIFAGAALFESHFKF